MNQQPNELDGRQRQTPRQSRLLGGLALLSALVGAGCKQEAKLTADTDPVGTYALVSVDGNKVPCTVRHEGHALAVQSGAFTLNADGTCRSQITLAGRDAAIEVKATYTRQGSKLTMQWQGAGSTTGMLESNTFTMENEGMVFAYRK